MSLSTDTVTHGGCPGGYFTHQKKIHIISLGTLFHGTPADKSHDASWCAVFRIQDHCYIARLMTMGSCNKFLRIFVKWSLSCFLLLSEIPLGGAQWLRGRAPDSRLREPGFESCAAVLKPWASFFTLHCSNSLSCINEYLAIDIGGYVYEQTLCINCSIWLDASQRSQDGV